MAYTNNVPQSTQTIASTQGPISANFTFLQSAIGQEHNFNVGDATQTYHKQAAMPNTGGTPTKPAACNGVYYVDGGEAKFLNNSGLISQLSLGVRATNGYQWVGLVLVQWGFSALTPNPIVFPIAFPSVCYNVQTTPTWSTGTTPNSAGTIYVKSNAVTTAGFTWDNEGSGNLAGFYWLAVGR